VFQASYTTKQDGMGTGLSLSRSISGGIVAVSGQP
jgi:signal transduction histidine kinase